MLLCILLLWACTGKSTKDAVSTDKAAAAKESKAEKIDDGTARAGDDVPEAGDGAAEADENAATVSETKELFAMDTYMTLTAYGVNAKEALEAAADEIMMLDDLLSTGNAQSEVSLLNESGKAILSDVTAYLLKRSLEVNSMSSGAFDPLVYPLMVEWGFTDKQFKVPENEIIKNLLELTDISLISYDEKTSEVSFGKDGVKIDFGGIAKGYTSSRIMEIFAEHGVTSAVISLGGNVQVLGSKPDGSKWKIAIRDPEDNSGFLGMLATSDKAVVTSGGYERFFEENGVVYHHILDPATGYPADSGLLSVSIVSSDGTLADGLSTALYVLGLEKGAEVWKEYSDQFDVIFMTEDHDIYVTQGISADFSSTAYHVNIITEDFSLD